jgi:hypothetical protein
MSMILNLHVHTRHHHAPERAAVTKNSYLPLTVIFIINIITLLQSLTVLEKTIVLYFTWD